MTTRHEIHLPELGLGEVPVLLSVWLVDVGQEVSAGDRLLELVAGSVCVDLSAPAGGVLSEALVSEDDQLGAGQLLGIITATGD